MNTQAVILRRALFTGAIFATALLVTFVDASKVTVDADGGAGYTSLDAVLSAINGSSIDPDTIEVIGSDQDTYSWSVDMTVSSVGTLVLRSTQTSPNMFPIITKSGGAGWAFMQSTNLYFENFIMGTSTTTDPYLFTNAQSSGKTISFKKCVIKDIGSDYFLKMEGGADNTTIIENCLFEGNAKIFLFDYWGGSPTVTITNCTFDANTELFAADLYSARATNVSIINCIFSSNTTTFPTGDVLKGKTTYSLTSEATTGYGTGCASNSNPSYLTGTRNNPSDWMIQTGSPAKNIGTATGAPSGDISGYSRSSPDAGCWEYQPPTNYTWDNSSTSGIQTGAGTWGSSSYWTLSDGDGTSLVAWPGAGYGATFGGADGTYAIGVNGTVNVDSICFLYGTYTLSGGTAVNLGTKNGIYVASGKTAAINTPITGSGGITLSGGGTLTTTAVHTYTGATTITSGTLTLSTAANHIPNSSPVVLADAAAAVFNANSIAETVGSLAGGGGSGGNITLGTTTLTIGGDNTSTSYGGIISGTGGLTKNGSGAQTFTGTNTYSGATYVSGGTLRVSVLANGAANSGIGSSSNSAMNLNIDGATLDYIGAGVSCDRLFTINANGSTISSNGSGALNLSNAGTIGRIGTFYETLTLGGDYTGASNTLAGILSDPSGGTKLSLTKSGSGTWILSATNIYTNPTTINSGTLLVTGSLASGSAVTVASGATLGGERRDQSGNHLDGNIDNR